MSVLHHYPMFFFMVLLLTKTSPISPSFSSQVLYLTYLALSSLQLKYDVHVMRGGLRFCHSTDIGSMLVFKVGNNGASGVPWCPILQSDLVKKCQERYQGCNCILNLKDIDI